MQRYNNTRAYEHNMYNRYGRHYLNEDVDYSYSIDWSDVEEKDKNFKNALRDFIDVASKVVMNCSNIANQADNQTVKDMYADLYQNSDKSLTKIKDLQSMFGDLAQIENCINRVYNYMNR